jgi:hypothetical protein
MMQPRDARSAHSKYKSRRGRPANREREDYRRGMRSALARAPRLRARSSVTGRTLTTRAIGYELWRVAEGRLMEQATPPPLDRSTELLRVRRDAVRVVRDKLVKRARQHVARTERGERVLALRMTTAAPGPRIVPAIGWHGLAGLYSSDWPTTIGRPGEATLEEAREAVARGGFELIALDVNAARAVLARLRSALPDDAAVAEEVASRYSRAEARTVERHVERVLGEARKWEYQHPGSEGFTGRAPLPEPRS